MLIDQTKILWPFPGTCPKKKNKTYRTDSLCDCVGHIQYYSRSNLIEWGDRWKSEITVNTIAITKNGAGNLHHTDLSDTREASFSESFRYPEKKSDQKGNSEFWRE